MSNLIEYLKADIYSTYCLLECIEKNYKKRRRIRVARFIVVTTVVLYLLIIA
jgi:hypothetical protein